MPCKPKRPCRFPGCPNLSDQPYCEAHRQKFGRVTDAQRGGAAARGYGRRWNEARLLFLSAHPLCAICAKDGGIVPATVVDHIVPHRGDPALFWDRGNWQSLCKSCHDRKTAGEDGGFGNMSK